MQTGLFHGAAGGGPRKRFSQFLLVLLFSFDLPPEVVVGANVRFWHNCLGTVFHDKVEIEDGAWIFQGVTFGDANSFKGSIGHGYEKIVVGKNASICAGAKVLCKEGVLRIGEGAVVAANAVVTRSVPDYEIWAGVPAKKIGVNDGCRFENL